MLNAHTRRAYAALVAYNALAGMGARPVSNGSRHNADARFDHTPDLGPLAVVWRCKGPTASGLARCTRSC